MELYDASRFGHEEAFEERTRGCAKHAGLSD
jgi:hypothetical protein